MENLHHPNVIRLYEVIETLSKLHIVMEYACGGELFAKISNEGKFAERTAKRYYTQVLSAVEHMVSIDAQTLYFLLRKKGFLYATNNSLRVPKRSLMYLVCVCVYMTELTCLICILYVLML